VSNVFHRWFSGKRLGEWSEWRRYCLAVTPYGFETLRSWLRRSVAEPQSTVIDEGSHHGALALSVDVPMQEWHGRKHRESLRGTERLLRFGPLSDARSSPMSTDDKARSTLLRGLLKRRLLGQFLVGTTFLQQDEETARSTTGSHSWQASLRSLSPFRSATSAPAALLRTIRSRGSSVELVAQWCLKG